MGPGVASLNFAEKVGSGLVSSLIWALLAAVGYVGGAAEQGDAVALGVTALFALGPALFLGTAALVSWGSPLNRDTVAQLRRSQQAARQRACGP